MPLWGSRQAGGNSDSTLNFTDVRPGDDYTLLDGTETVASGSKSTAFARGMSGSTDAGSTFNITGCTNNSVITIQSSNGVAGTRAGAPSFTLAQLDATFIDLPGAVFTGNGVYTDVGRAAFYRCVVTTLVAGDAPVVVVKR